MQWQSSTNQLTQNSNSSPDLYDATCYANLHDSTCFLFFFNLVLHVTASVTLFTGLHPTRQEYKLLSIEQLTDKRFRSAQISICLTLVAIVGDFVGMSVRLQTVKQWQCSEREYINRMLVLLCSRMIFLRFQAIWNPMLALRIILVLVRGISRICEHLRAYLRARYQRYYIAVNEQIVMFVASCSIDVT